MSLVFGSVNYSQCGQLTFCSPGTITKNKTKRKDTNMKVKNILKLTAISTALMLAGVARINAATTNLVQNISFALTCYEQGSTNHPSTNVTTIAVNKFRLTTKDIIGEIGLATSNRFSGKAQLVLVTDTASSNSVSTVEIRDGTNAPVDVSSFFTIGEGFGVRSLYSNSATGLSTGVRYHDLYLVETNSAASLNVRGFAVTTRISFKCFNNIVRVDTVDVDVAGTSVDTNGIAGVVNGSLSISGDNVKIEK
jgi:hypothetical protein